MKPTGFLTWEEGELAQSMHILDPIAYFKDGRNLAPMFRDNLILTVGMKRNSIAGSAFELLDETGAKWASRVMTAGGIYFGPQSMIGTGRSFSVSGFQEKLDGLNGFFVADGEKFPYVPYWQIPTALLGTWWGQGSLRGEGRLAREKFLELIDTAVIEY